MNIVIDTSSVHLCSSNDIKLWREKNKKEIFHIQHYRQIYEMFSLISV